MNIKDVQNLAELARIELSEEEKKELLSDMDSILGYVKQIEEVKTPTLSKGRGADPVGVGFEEYKLHNVWREDKLEEREFSKEIITEQFPDSQDGFLKVKKIL
jgi:aspartyl-tRNA(Asn)/glutamyl-tRNA(Gln) amidotransferase subunit C